jgi:hypothetical protein
MMPHRVDLTPHIGVLGAVSTASLQIVNEAIAVVVGVVTLMYMCLRTYKEFISVVAHKKKPKVEHTGENHD